jgi:FecR protein
MRCVLTMAVALVASSGAFAGDDGVWSISKSSGEVWVTTSGAEQASLKQDDTLKPGDLVRTGRNGRVLLVRGEETILISPNSVIGLPTDKKDGMSTTILQQAGSILLEVEKRNVKHFEVETPYLAAVVKGTHFSVAVNAANTSVNVERGQVEVSDFKTGQIAQILPGQTATSFAHGKAGLSLSGSGTFNPIEQGKPRASSIDRIPVPRGGLLAPHNGADGKVIHALNGHASFDHLANASTQTHPAKSNVIHLSTALGEVHLNVGKATHGLAHGAVVTASHGRVSRDAGGSTIWSDNKAGPNSVNALVQGGVNSATSATSAAATASTAAVTAAAATGSGIAGNGGSRNSATGNGRMAGNGNGNNGGGNNGNGNAGNNDNGNNGNQGNGNGGVGNGNGNGNGKH